MNTELIWLLYKLKMRVDECPETFLIRVRKHIEGTT
jgi:hypothetical protein